MKTDTKASGGVEPRRGGACLTPPGQTRRLATVCCPPPLLQAFHGERYDLRAWVVMPNHVHALFNVEVTPMAEILESWKKHTAQKANRLLGRRGEFWQADYWDTFMRNGEHELETRKYIENNPAKAGLVLDPKTWPWSSARLRDELGVLKL